MGNNTGQKPNFLELESLRSEFIEKSFKVFSHNLKVFLYYDYFQKVLQHNNKNLSEAFLSEFIYDYINVIIRFEVWGINPEFTQKIISQLSDLKTLNTSAEYLQIINTETERIENQLQKLDSILKGSSYPENSASKAFFPLVDREAPENFYGTIDSITIRINKCDEKDKFIIVPSEKEIEKNILEQCQNSWLLALNLLKVYVKKPYKYHEVIISFDKREGFYEGNSLGIALTLSFLEQLLGFYNPVYIIKIKEQSAFTGGVTETGKVLCTSEEIIKQKVAAVFYSEINTFVIPKTEETYAYFALTQLTKQYPERNLKLIPVEDIADVLNRRDLVEIKKRNPVVRTGKFVKKNWVSAIATILLAIIFAFLFVMDFDDNPATLSADSNTLYIKNKKGNVLWTKPMPFDTNKPMPINEILRVARIVDIDHDGKNEVLLTNESDSEHGATIGLTSLKCYNKSGEIIWTYSFTDKVFSKREVLNTEYGLTIVDTLTYYFKPSLFLVASNGPSFGSAIHRIELTTGKRLPGTFWSSGHVISCLIKDIENDGRPDIIGAGYDNGYEDLVCFIYEIDTLTKVRPTTEGYLIRNFSVSPMKSFVRFPKTDFDIYSKVRTPVFHSPTYLYNSKNKKFMLSSNIPGRDQEVQIGYMINSNFLDIDIVIGSGFRVTRDTLVAHGVLKPPYTDTEEYKNIIKSKILYWKNGKWVEREHMN